MQYNSWQSTVHRRIIYCFYMWTANSDDCQSTVHTCDEWKEKSWQKKGGEAASKGTLSHTSKHPFCCPLIWNKTSKQNREKNRHFNLRHPKQNISSLRRGCVLAHLAKTRMRLGFGSLAVSRIWNSSALQGTKHADKHAMFKSLSLGGEHYRRLASTVRRCRHLTAEKIQLHAHEDKKIALQKSLHKNNKDKQDICRELK